MILVDFNESSFLKDRKVITEVEVDGQPVDNDENTPPDDYTADGGDDTQATADAGSDQPDGSEGGDEAPAEDYTQGGDDAGGDPDAGGEGGGDDGIGGDEGGDPDAGGDAGDAGGDGSGEQADDARGLEQEIFADLTPAQLALKHQELKSNFLKVYDSTAAIIDRINEIPSDERFTPSISYVNKQLSTFRDTLTDYINDVYSTKSYMENQVNYYKFLNVLHSINQILDEINKEIQ